MNATDHKKYPLLNRKEYCEDHSFKGDLQVEEMQMKQAPAIQTATETCLKFGPVKVKFVLIKD